MPIEKNVNELYLFLNPRRAYGRLVVINLDFALSHLLRQSMELPHLPKVSPLCFPEHHWFR